MVHPTECPYSHGTDEDDAFSSRNPNGIKNSFLNVSAATDSLSHSLDPGLPSSLAYLNTAP